MAAMAELSLTLDLMGKCFKTLLYWIHLDNWNQTFQECSFDGPLQIQVFYADWKSKLATISSRRFMGDSVGNQSLEGPLYKLCVFYVDRNSKMTTTAGHSFYIGPIGSFLFFNHFWPS